VGKKREKKKRNRASAQGAVSDDSLALMSVELVSAGPAATGAGRERALDTWLKLIRAAESLKTRLASRLAPQGLTLGQFGVLEAVFHCGPLCQRDLARKLQVSGGNMTTVIDNLERRGLVQRVRSHRDRRYIAVHLSSQGDALIRELFPEQAEAIRRDMGALSAKRLERLGRSCRDLGLSIKIK